MKPASSLFFSLSTLGLLFLNGSCSHLEPPDSGADRMPPAIPVTGCLAAAMSELEAARGRAGAPVIVQDAVREFLRHTD